MCKIRLLRASLLLAVFMIPVSNDGPRCDESLATSLQKLRKLPESEEYSYGTVPPEAQSALLKIKRELRDLILFRLNHAEPGQDLARETRDGLIHELKDQGIVVGKEPDYRTELGYGYVLQVNVESLGNDASLVVTTTRLSITCGDDSSLMVFRRGPSGWQTILVDEAPIYDQISGAHGSLEWRASERKSKGSILLVVAEIPQWCSSVWRPLRYRAYRVGSGFEKPVQLISDSTEAIAMDEGYAIHVEPFSFALSYSANDENDPGSRVKKTVKFRVHGNTVLAEKTRPDG
jgi:hypothetical protein